MGLTMEVTLPSQTAGGADSITVIGTVSDVGGADNQLIRAELIAAAGTSVTGATTNNATISVRQLRAGSVISTPATITFASGTNLAAENPVQLTVTPTALKEGDVLDVLMHQNGTGLAIPAGIRVEVEDNFTTR